MNVIYPPRKVRRLQRPTLFIAGSIEMDTAARWQDVVVTSLTDYKGTLLNPRRKEWDASWKQETGNPNFVGQVNWELDGIEKCDYVAFYFDPTTKSPVTLLELGLAIGLKKKIYLACPTGFWRKGNVDIVSSRSNIEVHASLTALIEALQAVLQKKEEP